MKKLLGAATLASVIVLALTACNKDDGGNSPVCTAGSTQACTCVGGGSGVQICNAAGTGWDVCQCSPADTWTDPDVPVDAAPDTTPDIPVDTTPDVPACPVTGDYEVTCWETSGDCGYTDTTWTLSLIPDCAAIIADIIADGATVANCSFEPDTCLLTVAFAMSIPETVDEYGMEQTWAFSYGSFSSTGLEGLGLLEIDFTESGTVIDSCASDLQLSGTRI